MRKKSKSAWFLVAVSSLVSTGVAQGNYTGNYTRAVNATLHPERMEQVKVFYELMGWPLFAVLLVPLGTYLILGVIYEEHKRKKYWLMSIPAWILTFVGGILFPVVLMMQL